MKISKKWLEQYMDLDGLSMEDIAAAITAAGFEVEGIEPLSSGTNLVIGEVLECTDHPDSDHLHVTKVNIGDEIVQIVCGAPNVAAGQKVIVAKPGARLPGGEIKAGSIRGQESNGMICALFELGVDRHMLSQAQLDGIEILPADAPVGHPDPLGYLGYDDTVLDIALTPNRADCLSAFNMASEIGAVINRKVTLPDYEGSAEAGSDKETRMRVFSESEGCPLFIAKVIGSVTIQPSPAWMKEVLRAAGMHSINNVVDISNIVMLETGQPMHFYDINALPAQEITVKDNLDTVYTALDGEEYTIVPGDMMITTEGRPIGIAGIMGGDDSKILDSTQGLIIECASFENTRIRKTARRLNLNTEASQRYQKGIEPLAPVKAVDRAVQLLIEYADAADIEKTVMFGAPDWEEKKITVELHRINSHLGTSFSFDEVIDVFERLGFRPQAENETITVTIPSTRPDIEGMADLSEEVIRMLGYDRLPSTLPLMEMTEGKLDPAQKQRRFVRTMLTERGLQDCVTYTLVSDAKDENAILSCGTAIALPTPLSEERKKIRTSILPSLLDVVAFNKARGIKDVNVFEISDLESQEKNERHLAIALNGMLEDTRWLHYEKPDDFYTLKGIVEELLERTGIAPARIQFKENTLDTVHFHPYRSALIYIGKDLAGILGEIHPTYAENGTEGTTMAELNLDTIRKVKKSKVKFTPVSKYPAVSRDLAFVVKRSMPVSRIVDVIRKNGKLKKELVVRDVNVFDIYTGDHVAEDEKSVALNVVMQSDRQTLNEAEISEIFQTILHAIEKECQAVLRSA